MRACVASAPTPPSACGQSAPTAKKRVATAMPKAPVSGWRAMMDQVIAKETAFVGGNAGRRPAYFAPASCFSVKV